MIRGEQRAVLTQEKVERLRFYEERAERRGEAASPARLLAIVPSSWHFVSSVLQ